MRSPSGRFFYFLFFTLQSSFTRNEIITAEYITFYDSLYCVFAYCVTEIVIIRLQLQFRDMSCHK